VAPFTGWEVIPWSLRHAAGSGGSSRWMQHDPAVERDFVAGTRHKSHYLPT
jgi:hypothetical protein